MHFYGVRIFAIFGFFKGSMTHKVKIHCNKVFSVLFIFSVIEGASSLYNSLKIRSWETNSIHKILRPRIAHKEKMQVNQATDAELEDERG